MTGSTIHGPRRPRVLAGRTSVALVATVALVTIGLLYRTQSNAAQIRAKTHRIAASTQGINTYTDAILQLDKTNKLAASILHSVAPISDTFQIIEGQSDDIADLVRSIRGSSQSINRSATSIEGRADKSAASLAAINSGTSQIAHDLGLIQEGVRILGADLTGTSDILADILADARGLDTRTRTKAAPLSPTRKEDLASTGECIAWNDLPASGGVIFAR